MRSSHNVHLSTQNMKYSIRVALYKDVKCFWKRVDVEEIWATIWYSVMWVLIVSWYHTFPIIFINSFISVFVSLGHLAHHTGSSIETKKLTFAANQK